MILTPQRGLSCPCGRSKIVARGLCAVCYSLQRHDRDYFGGLREVVLRRDGYRCRVCGSPGHSRRTINVHHRRPGVSRLPLMLALCPGCHARIEHTLVLRRLWPALLRQLWREIHPRGAEQLPLSFTRNEVDSPQTLPLPL